VKILIITNLDNECSVEDIWIAESFINDGHIVKLVNKYYDKTLEDEYDIFIKRYSWIEDIDDFSVGAEESDYETRILRKNLPRINFDGKFDNQGKHYLADLYKLGYQVVPTFNNPEEIQINSKSYLIKPVNGYAGFGIIEASKDKVKDYWNSDYVIQPKIDFNSEVQFYFIGNQFQFAQVFIPKKLLSHENAEFYEPSKNEIDIATSFANLNGNDFNGVQRIDFLKANGQLLLSELEDDSPYMAIEALSPEARMDFINNFKKMVYDYYKSFKKNKSRVLKR
jgi:hypothetical protein